MSEALLEKAKQAQRIGNAFRRLFATEDGKLVLENIREAFGLHMPAFIPQERGRHCEYDPIHAAIRDGQRQVLLHIETILAAPTVGDGNIKTPKTRVKKS
jgi:hypothetical protein